ncbi:MAG: transcriptional regulator [Alphaproteobacteria bacterium]|jgi:DNA-binding winged helix-turn-helix (wHTH) protein|nr:transcriptional regulator [Alphaproteobacteria bacterium]MBU2042110.1 transcriptional regulator [Alphaproteobacteria bacterium]MBU2127262.1 transcriptional regulator [Alphaproteobacteria bacterium]MBU2208243.1 transcriptional regulator [Alphaproteobacteria bacterium]MBU2291354.1 transcriptional regulator [Alphaproteobacteria bacterium]
MPSGSYGFDGFRLDPADRRLTRDGAPVELNARYLDALSLLVREQGRLVSKDRFLAEVWRGVPVTDEALTQCIRTIRRQLGDDAARPRFIETVPKHGYRFIAPVSGLESAAAPPAAPTGFWPPVLQLGGAGMFGGGVAGALGGLFYGFGAAQPLPSGMGSASIVLVLIIITAGVGLIGGAGVAFGIAAARQLRPRFGFGGVLGGAFGGLIVGAVVKLLGVDAFNLLFGQSPAAMTGAGEGALLGATIGFGTWLCLVRGFGLRVSVAAAALTGAVVGVLIARLGGRLMGGSLDLLARQFPDSRLSLDPIGGLFGEAGFGPISQTVTGGIEGALFCGFVVAAVVLSQRPGLLRPPGSTPALAVSGSSR